MKKVCAIVPLYNEEDSVLETIRSLKKVDSIDSIVAIDDGSRDGTWDIIKDIEGIELIRHKENRGKAQSIKDGVHRYDSDIYVLVDGDLACSAEKIKPLVDEIMMENCDMCIAKMPDSTGGGIGFLKIFAKLGVKAITKVDFPCPISGIRAVKSKVINDKRVKMYRGFGVEVGMLVGAIKSGYRIKTIELNLKHRVTGRDINGYVHRIKQFKDIFFVFLYEILRW